MRHNPSRAEIHAHMYQVIRGDVDASPTTRAMAEALNAKLRWSLDQSQSYRPIYRRGSANPDQVRRATRA